MAKKEKKATSDLAKDAGAISRNRSGAIELSMSTIVIIVLSVIVLIAGIYFLQKIFTVATNSIDSIDSQVQSELQKMFSNDDSLKVAFYPESRDVSITKGDTPKGFAFQIRNNDVNDATFSYQVTATDTSKCGSFSETDANAMLLGGSGSVDVGRGSVSEAMLVRFVVPDSAPKCPMVFDLKVTKGSSAYDDTNFFLTIK